MSSEARALNDILAFGRIQEKVDPAEFNVLLKEVWRLREDNKFQKEMLDQLEKASEGLTKALEALLPSEVDERAWRFLEMVVACEDIPDHIWVWSDFLKKKGLIRLVLDRRVPDYKHWEKELVRRLWCRAHDHEYEESPDVESGEWLVEVTELGNILLSRRAYRRVWYRRIIRWPLEKLLQLVGNPNG